MNSLEEKTNEWLDAYWPSQPVTGRAAAPAISADARQDVRTFWLDDRFLYDDEPLPSMFTSKIKACEAGPRSTKACLAGPMSLAARLSKRQISTRTASYFIASFLVIFAAVDGFLLATSTFSADRRALLEQGSAAPEVDRTETAIVPPAPSPKVARASKASSLAQRQAVSPESEPWPAAVATFKQLIAEAEASKAAAMKPADNDRLIGQLENWMNASTQKPSAVAQACTAPAHQCWKGKTVVRRKVRLGAPRATEHS